MPMAPPRIKPDYECPSCQALLRAGPDNWNGWLRCPRCDTPTLPPEPRDDRPIDSHGDDPTRAPVLTPEEWARQARRAAWNPLRLVLVTGLGFSLFMSLISFLDQNMSTGVVFRVLTVIFLVLLFRPRRRPRAPRREQPGVDGA